MATSNCIKCGPCGADKTISAAVIWCYNCNEGLCSKCSVQHKRLKLTHGHKTFDVKTYTKLPQINTECHEHSRQFDLYCQIHLTPCCDECVSIQHSKCSEIKCLATVIDKTKTAIITSLLEKDIASILSTFDEVINTKTENIKHGDEKQQKIQEDIKHITKGLQSNHLDRLKVELQNDLDSVWDNEKLKTKAFINEIEEKKTDLNEILHSLLALRKHSSKTQQFLGVHQIEQQMNQYKRYIDQLWQDGRMKDVCIDVEENSNFLKVVTAVESLESLGHVFVVRKEATRDNDNISREVQVECRDSPFFRNISLELETKKDILHINDTLQVVTAMICLNSNRVILIAGKERLLLFRNDCNFEKNIKVLGEPFGVAELENDAIAVSFPNEMVVKIIDLNNDSVEKVIKLYKKCLGLSSLKNTIAVGLHLQRNDEIRVIDLEGNTLKSVNVASETLLFEFLFTNNGILCSDNHGLSVSFVDWKGKQVWEFKSDDLKDPQGICTDNYGNIFLADDISDKVVVISRDGKRSNVLLSEKDGIEEVRSICFSKMESVVFISDVTGTYLTKYKVIYG